MSASAIPDDFPRGAPAGAVPGAQPKLLVHEEAGRFVPGWPTDTEVLARYEACEDLVQQLVRYSARKQAERPHWSSAEVREKVAASVRVKSFRWGLSPAEAEWILRRLATEAGPPAAVGEPTS
jgi:hypothetical protein